MRMDESYVPLTKEGEDGDDSVRHMVFMGHASTTCMPGNPSTNCSSP